MANPFVRFVLTALRAALRGGPRYWIWLSLLLLAIGLGACSYATQLTRGLAATALSDAVPWGVYIGNFTFVSGAAAAVSLLLVPAYGIKDETFRAAVVWTELLVVALVSMALLFVLVDVGHPERAWHLLPIVGRLNWPASMLAWDVIVLPGYLVFNGYIAGHTLFRSFLGHAPARGRLRVAVTLAVVWAIIPVSASLYAGVVARPFWHSAVLAPRFLASALAAGPALAALVLLALRRARGVPIEDGTVRRLGQVAGFALLADLFLQGAEAVVSLGGDGVEAHNAFRYAWLGLPGATATAPCSWAALGLDLFAALALLVPPLRKKPVVLLVGCAAAAAGGWIEKGVALLMPGFVPTPLGEVAGYVPSLSEVGVTLGIAATGALVYTLLAKAALGVQGAGGGPPAPLEGGV